MEGVREEGRPALRGGNDCEKIGLVKRMLLKMAEHHKRSKRESRSGSYTHSCVGVAVLCTR